MSDDEEVVLRKSELYKYVAVNNFDELISVGNDGEESNVALPSKTKDDSSTCKVLRSHNFTCSYRNPILHSHTSAMVYAIFKTGLMYPDHIGDIETYLKIDNITPQSHLYDTSIVLNSILVALLGSSVAIGLCFKKMRTIHYASVLAASVCVGYKMFENLKMFYEKKKIKHFADTLECLFSITKRSLSLIFESEFLLKTKIVKEQSVYVSDEIGWVNACTAEGLQCSGLLLPEFRNILAEVYFNVILIFSNLTSQMRLELNLLPNIDCDNNYTQLPDDTTLKKIALNPSLEDLKKLNSVYLVAQSEFLRRLILSFVKDFWDKSSSTNSLNYIIEEITNSINKFQQNTHMLESFYKRCTKMNENKDMQIERNKLLNARNANDKIFIFARNFLTKADAHMLSLSLDLKMLGHWINECEVNNKESDVNRKKVLEVLLDRLVSMKSNIDLFTSFYNDNYNILKNISSKSSDDVDNVPSGVESSIDRIQKTGVEVGKSNFDFTGEDEVLISLCNSNVPNENSKLLDDNYEEEEIQKCLPKNVLLELKCALKCKKEEWIEREKKALKSDDSIGKLDFDTLSSSVDGDADNILLSNKNCKFRSKFEHSNHEYSSDDEENSLSNSEDASVFGKQGNVGPEFFIQSNSFTDLNVNKNYQSNLLDQIKCAQKSFTLSMKEEEFIGDVSDDSLSEDEN